MFGVELLNIKHDVLKRLMPLINEKIPSATKDFAFMLNIFKDLFI